MNLGQTRRSGSKICNYSEGFNAGVTLRYHQLEPLVLHIQIKLSANNCMLTYLWGY